MVASRMIESRDVIPAVLANASPSLGDMWFSSSLARLAADPSPSKRFPLGITGQEQSVWYANGRFNNTFTNGAGHIAYTYCTASDPTVSANWAAPVEIMGGGAGGFAGTCARSYIYQESSTLYLFFLDLGTNNVRVATAALSNPLTWTLNGSTVIGPQGTGVNGNICVVKDGSTYRMFLECLHQDNLPIEGTTNSWQIVMATASAVAGPYTVQINPVTSLRMTANASVSGAWLTKEGSTWVMYYHGASWARVFPNDIYRATTTDLSTDSWTLDNGGYPFMRRAHRYEVDQAVDPCICQGPNGLTYLFYTAADNRNSLFKLMVTVLRPIWHQWDGTAWKQVQSGCDMTPPNTEQFQLVQFPVVAGPRGSTQNTVGTWALDTAVAPYRINNASAAQNDMIEYDVTLAPGNYQIDVWYQKGSNKAIIALDYEDGAGSYFVTLPTIDAYAAGTSQYNKATRLLRVFGTETYRRRIRFKASTKNASSSAYEIALHAVQIRDDGFYPDLVVNGRFDEGVTSWGTQGAATTWSATSNQFSIVRGASLDAAPTQLVTGLTVGKQYKLLFDVVSGVSVNANWGSNNQFNVGAGNAVTFTATAVSQSLQFWPTATGTSVIANVSVREVAS